jgi:2-phospho-L-lactate transferase/gluconeogenesis factor (CofD/UPF0052 family)
VSGIAQAVAGSSARRIYVCNVANMRGETSGLDAADHVTALVDHGLVGALDVVLVHDPCAPDSTLCDDVAGVEPVFSDADVIARIEALGPRVVAAALADPADPVRHSRVALLRTLEGVVA